MKKKEPIQLKGLIIPILIACLNVLIVIFPQDVLLASRNGVTLWFNNVLPALVPFIIGTNILAGLGFVSFLGTLLEPVMYPLFGVPGCGGYALVTGMLSGYPVGAKTTASLYETNMLDKNEAERLLSFCNNAGPLFILGAVGNGMFGSASIGYFIMLSHFSAAIITGCIFKFYKIRRNKKSINSRNLFSQAVRNMEVTRQRGGQNFGEVLASGVKNAMETVTVIGGFIILFCVIVKIIEAIDVMYWVIVLFKPAITFFSIDTDLFRGFFIGLIEVTNGCAELAACGFSKTQLLLTVAIISFGGLSIFAQTISFISKTAINPFVYLVSKIIQSVISVAVAYLIFPLFNFSQETVAVYFAYDNGIMKKYAMSSMLFFISILTLTAAIMLLTAFRRANSNKRYD